MKFIKALEEIFNEVVMTRRTSSEKRLFKKAKRRAHKNTNWNYTKPKKGFKRVKVGKNRYIFERMSGAQKIALKRIGKSLGKAKNLRK